jgi:hypothetical protein
MFVLLKAEGTVRQLDWRRRSMLHANLALVKSRRLVNTTKGIYRTHGLSIRFEREQTTDEAKKKG